MKTIHKFVIKAYLGPMLLTFFIVMFVLIMQFMWRYLDDLVGKGLDLLVILELLMYAAGMFIPMVLPLATLLAAIMTMGNLGENYELLAMKSAGMSLPRIIKPLIILAFLISIGSFFANNNLVPYSNRKLFALIVDIQQQKQTIEFKDGIFFNGIENLSIRVDHQNPESGLLSGVLIYDTRDYNGNMSTTLAKQGFIRLSDDKKFLNVRLFDGSTYESTRSYKWLTDNKLSQRYFKEQNAAIPLAGYDFSRTEGSMMGGTLTLKIDQLQHGIDSLSLVSNKFTTQSYEPLIRNYLFTYDRSMLSTDSIKVEPAYNRQQLLVDSIPAMTIYQKKEIWGAAKNSINSSRSVLTFDEESAKDTIGKLYKFKIEWHKKVVLPVSIMIFFLIGASLGAIIRKGGLGMPVVVSVSFYLIYYVISLTGEKMSREGAWESYLGVWMSTYILLPLALFLIYKASHDSNLFNAEIYLSKINKVKVFVNKVTEKIKIRWKR